MIILRLFLGIFAFFTLMVFALGALLWIKIRLHLKSPFAAPGNDPANPRHMRDGKTIEGQYKILDETFKE